MKTAPVLAQYIPIMEKLLELPHETEVQEDFQFKVVKDLVYEMVKHSGELRETYMNIWVNCFYFDNMVGLYEQIKKDAGL